MTADVATRGGDGNDLLKVDVVLHRRGDREVVEQQGRDDDGRVDAEVGGLSRGRPAPRFVSASWGNGNENYDLF